MYVFEYVDLGIAWPYLLWGVAAYLLGSVSLGDIVARAAGFPIRDVGTGNPGTANIFREMGARYATLVLVLDMLKGSAAMLPMFVFDVTAWAGMVGAGGVLAGHYLPIFWNFKGGTGMVVAIGVCFGLSPIGGLAGIPRRADGSGLEEERGLEWSSVLCHRWCGGLVVLLECGTRRACGPCWRECRCEELHSVRVDVECG